MVKNRTTCVVMLWFLSLIMKTLIALGAPSTNSRNSRANDLVGAIESNDGQAAVNTRTATAQNFLSIFRDAQLRPRDMHWFVYYSLGNREGLPYEGARDKCIIDGGFLAKVTREPDGTARHSTELYMIDFLLMFNDLYPNPPPAGLEQYYASTQPVWIDEVNTDTSAGQASVMHHGPPNTIEPIPVDPNQRQDFPFVCEFASRCASNPYTNPCQNGAVCNLIGSGGRDYECDCANGFSGTNCDNSVNECESMPCQNGLCLDDNGFYVCDCSGSGFTGDNCEQDEDECIDAGWCNGGVCQNVVGSWQCSSCPDSRRGRRCESSAPAAVESGESGGGVSSGAILFVIFLMAVIAGVVTWVMYKRYKDRELILRGKKGIKQEEVETHLSKAKLGEPKVGSATSLDSEEEESDREVKLRFNHDVQVLHMIEPRVMDQFKEALEDPAPGAAAAPAPS